MVAPIVGKNLGKLFRNIQNIEWLAVQAAETAVSQVFLSPIGHKVHAYLHVHIFHGDQQIGSVYQAPDGHFYVKTTQGERFWLNQDQLTWHNA